MRDARTGMLAMALAAALAAAATGCGSTVQPQDGALTVASDGALQPSGGDGLSVPGTPVDGSAPAPLSPAGEVGGPAPAVASGGGARSAAPAGPGTGAAPGGGSRAPLPPPPPATGPGFTAKEIFIGVAYNAQLSDQMASAGAAGGGAVLGDQKNQVLALVRDINERGGIAGRKVVPVFYNTNGDQANANAATQAACAKWTEDSRVFAAMTFVAELSNDNMYSCLAKRQVVFVPLAGESAVTFQRFSPYLWMPTGVSVERVAPVWVQRLAALGYFTGWNTTIGGPAQTPVKIGILLGNGARNAQPSLDKALEQSLRSQLARHKVPVAATFSMTTIDQGSAAVLRFKEAGVTHVIGDFSIALFAQPAESQRYRPRYGVSTFSGGIALQLYAPSVQLNGAVGIGWSPQGDVDTAQDPGDVSPAEARCRKIMKGAGEPTESRLAWFVMTLACDTFTFFDTAIEGSGLRASELPGAAAALGAVPPAFTFGISYPDGRPDGVTYARDVTYRSDCSCFAYLSKSNHAM